MVLYSEAALEQVSVFWKIPYATYVASLFHLCFSAHRNAD